MSPWSSKRNEPAGAAPLFGTDGIRAEFGRPPLDEPSLLRLGTVIGRLFPGARFLIGRDPRPSGLPIEELLGRSLGADCRIQSAGIIPTPGLAYLTRHHGFDFGIMISASHNPHQDNGIKLFSGRGEKISSALEKKIATLFHASPSPTPPAATARARRPAITPLAEKQEYLRFLVSQGRPLAGTRMKLIADLANGAARGIMPDVFRELGIKGECINDRADGRHINDQCGSTQPDACRRQVLAAHADLGISFDGDADRAVFVTGQGRLMDGDYSLLVIARDMINRQPAFNRIVVGTIMSNIGLEKILSEDGIRLVRSPVGDSRVYWRMKRQGAILGGEPSGHTILRHLHTTGDGILTAIVFLTALQNLGLSADELFSRFPVSPQKLLNIPIRRRRLLKNWLELKQLESEFQRRHGSDSRLLIRYSGTEPMIRVMIESRRKEIIDDYLKKFSCLIKSSIGV